MSLAPRIVVVDSNREIVPIVRGAMALLSRAYVLVEVPTVEAVLEEIQRTPADLVVAAYVLPDGANGLELATRINHVSLGTRVLVVADRRDQLPDDLDVAGNCQVFVRPVAGPFLRGLMVALDGDTVVGDETASVENPLPDPGRMPPIDLPEVQAILVNLMRDVGAMGVILANRRGRVLVHAGATGYIDRDRLSAVVGPSLAQAIQVSPLVGGHAWTMQYYNGERLDVYALSLGFHYVVCLIFESSHRRALASVMLYGRRAVDLLIDSIGEDAYAVESSAPRPEADAPIVPRQGGVLADGDQLAPATAELDNLVDRLELASVGEPLDSFDPDALFSQPVDERLANSLFDPDALEDLAAEMGGGGEDRLDYNDAVNLGILEE